MIELAEHVVVGAGGTFNTGGATVRWNTDPRLPEPRRGRGGRPNWAVARYPQPSPVRPPPALT